MVPSCGSLECALSLGSRAQNAVPCGLSSGRIGFVRTVSVCIMYDVAFSKLQPVSGILTNSSNSTI